ncbi:MAG: diguanylate cyclase [Pseudomonadales bacterium]|nr:diguanylate cyclase [Pseudomonadales bacterium]
MLKALRRVWQSRLVNLTFSMLMLTVSVFLFADFFLFRGHADETVRESRKSVAEALAVQLTVMAGEEDLQAIRETLAAFASRSNDITAISLTRASGEVLARAGDISRFENAETSTLSELRVPIFQRDEPWGEVRVAFVPYSDLPRKIAYLAFITVSCLILYSLFLRKALHQIDPSRVVPGRVNTAFNLLSEAIVILDTDMQVMLANDATARLFKTTPDRLIGQKIDHWNWRKRDADEPSPWSIAIETGSYASHEPHKLSVEGKTFKLMVNCAAVGSSENRTRGVLVTLDDMTSIEAKNQELASTLRLLKRTQVELLEKNKELQTLATSDPLTGVRNRRALMERLEEHFARAEREQLTLSCLMVDIDHFKKINDTHGHGVGDDVIRLVARTLSSQCREYDVVGRYGGEEFLVVFPGLGTQQAGEIAERIRLAIAGALESEDLPVQSLTASLGVAALDSHCKDAMTLVDQADQALYAAKQGGRNRVCVYDSRVIKLYKEDGATLPVGADQPGGPESLSGL